MKQWSMVLLATMLVGSVAAAGEFRDPTDPALAAARRYVEKSDRYLHHSKLKRGMKGYGLTVFAGTKIEKFNVTIVSVIRGHGSKIDAILATCKGHNLEQSQVAQGMSGSPVYMKDPKDGKWKMIGATAFGWAGSLNTIFGIQPITQMLALPGIVPENAATLKGKVASKAKQKNKGKAKKRSRTDRPAGLSRSARDTEDFFRIILDPKKGDFAKLYRKNPSMENAEGQLTPLRTPLMISGCSSKSLQWLRTQFASMGLNPVAGGSFAGVTKKELDKVKLEPGSALVIPFVTGDADWAGVGTVTEVIGNKVLGFGHSMDGAGNVNLPMYTGYIHTIVPTRGNSFKLGSSIKSVGTLNRDEEVAVGGVVGPKVRMIPLTVHVNQAEDKRKQTFNYKIVNDWYYTPRFAAALVTLSSEALRVAPMHHHIKYEVSVDFGKLGKYTAVNISNGDGCYDAASDLHRALAGVMVNPFVKPPKIERIDAKVTVLKGDIAGRIIDAKLDADIYKPGDTVTGHVLLERFRQKRLKVPFRLKLPESLPEGKHPLKLGGMYLALQTMRTERPAEFTPRNLKQLLKALQAVATPKGNHLYMHLPLPETGLAIGQKTLPDLPSSKASVLIQAAQPDTKPFRRSILTSQKTDHVISGMARLTVTVKKHTNQTLVRE